MEAEHDWDFGVWTYRTDADLVAAVAALDRYCGPRALGERWMIATDTFEDAEFAAAPATCSD